MSEKRKELRDALERVSNIRGLAENAKDDLRLDFPTREHIRHAWGELVHAENSARLQIKRLPDDA